jgi:hypothetical protein
MISAWQPFREPLRITMFRNGTIAIVAGFVLAGFRGGLTHWPILTLLALWPSLGGHWVEVWFLNWLRPRLCPGRGAQAAARVAVWFVGGAGLAICMVLTAHALAGFELIDRLYWWVGGIAFIGIELTAHLALQLRGRPSFYNGRG